VERQRRKSAGVNRKLPGDYIWPEGFGVSKVFSVTTSEAIRRMELPPESQEDDVPVNIEDCDDDEHQSVALSNRSNVSLNLQRKRLALETEKAKQALEMEAMKLQKKMSLLQMEHDLRVAEIDEAEELASLKSNYMTDRPRVKEGSCKNSAVNEWISSTEPFTKCNPEEPRRGDSSDMHLLCQTLTDAIKSITVSPMTNKLAARQIVEKDFPLFDGNPEEWPVFVAQFRRISSLCEYTVEEMMIKLQKCLRGEAKNAVVGMMMSPDNVDLVIKTLEMRFGRPDQIIATVLSKVQAITPVKENNLENVIQMSNAVRGLVATVKSLCCRGHLENPQLLKDLLMKLPDTLKLRWGEVVMKRKGDVNLEDFSNWLSRIATAACFVSTPENRKTSSSTSEYFRKGKLATNKNRQETTLTVTNPETTPFETECSYCELKNHKTINCPRLKANDVETRWKVVTKRKLCFSCLRKNHRTFQCRTKRPCGVDGCMRSHNKLLHKKNVSSTSPTSSSPSLQTTQTNDDEKESENVLVVGQKNQVLLRQIKVRLYGEHGVMETVALCDEASTISLIDKAVANHLGLKGTSEPLCIQWTNDIVSRHERSTKIDLRISGVAAEARKFTMKNVRTVENLSLPRQQISRSDWTRHPHLRDLPISEFDEQPMILIGQDNIHLTVARKVHQGPQDAPIATKTHLGWILHGPVQQKNDIKAYTFHICHHEYPDDDLHEIVKRSFTTEAFGVNLNCWKANKDEARAQEIMKKTARRVGDRFEIGLLWRSDDITLPESKMTAMRRLQCVERRMVQDRNFRQQYCEKIQDYVDKGYARKLSPDEAAVENPRCWYLPHFGVVNINKPNKLRLVFDAASKSHGMSLNDNLLAGPDLLKSLVAVLMKFRQRKIAYCSDVREMFHQVRIRPEDRCAQRFLWREGNSDRPCDVYEMQVMTFGATCSPTCAQYIKNLNATEQAKSQEILNAILDKHYVDDYLDCKDTINEAMQTILEVRRVQELGGFELVNWVSNSKELMELLCTEERIAKHLNLDSDSALQRVLGLWWDPTSDTFQFRLKSEMINFDKNQRPTKRNVLKLVMSIFDPLGLIANFTIRGRILLQEIWRSGIDWDDRIDQNLHRLWLTWIDDLQNITTFRIPRCYSTDSSREVELHVFCDASKKAFAAAAYLRIMGNNSINVCLIVARGRVAPTKPISIPRLELQAAVMGSRLASSIKQELEIRIDQTFLWTDSTTVLHWIRGNGKKVGQFESHRIGEIQELTNVEDWRWIPSKLNVADDAIRTYDTDE
jgi:hypothetical protein